MPVKLCFILLCVLTIGLSHGMGKSVCPESKKLYPGDCRLFYKCVPVLSSAQAYVWVPTRCTAGLVFEPTLKMCVLAGDDWDCKKAIEDYTKKKQEQERKEEIDQETDEEDTVYLDSENETSDEAEVNDTPLQDSNSVEMELVENPENENEPTPQGMTNNINVENISVSEYHDKLMNIIPVAVTTPSTSSSEEYVRIDPVYNAESSILNALEPSSVPLSAVNNPDTDKDPIGTQMHRLTQLINSLKTSPDDTITTLPPDVYSTPLKYIPYQTFSNSYDNSNSNYNKPFQKYKIDYRNLTLLPTQLNQISQTYQAQQQYNKLYSSYQPTKYFVVTSPTVQESSQKYAPEKYLFNKYLSNNEFLVGGEFKKKTTTTTTSTTEYPVRYISNAYSTQMPLIKIESYPTVHYPIPSRFHVKTSCKLGERIPNPRNCSRYFLCRGPDESSMLSFACSPHTAFSTVKKMCDVNEYDRCKSTQPSENTENYFHEQQMLDETSNEFLACKGIGRIADPTSRNHYAICVPTRNGWKRHRIRCPNATEFCASKQLCLSPSYCY